MNSKEKKIRNISFKISEEDYEAIKKFAKEKRQMNLKGYLIWLAKQDMKQPDFEMTNDDTHASKIKKLEQLVDIQNQEIAKYKKTLNSISIAIENYNK